MAEETFDTSSAMLMALTMTVAAAVPSRFIAVPTSVWSALKLIAATASRSEYSIPKIIAISVVRRMTTTTAVPSGMYFIISAPPSAPKTMMPSSPMLITPECSEKHPPSATSSRTDANISIYCSKSVI